MERQTLKVKFKVGVETGRVVAVRYRWLREQDVKLASSVKTLEPVPGWYRVTMSYDGKTSKGFMMLAKRGWDESEQTSENCRLAVGDLSTMIEDQEQRETIVDATHNLQYGGFNLLSLQVPSGEREIDVTLEPCTETEAHEEDENDF